MAAQCLHCHRKRFIKARGLCFSCWAIPSILVRYPACTKFNSRNVGLTGHGAPEPTDAMPGSEEKIEVLAMRAEKGQAMHHKDDAKFDMG